jgi:hypothetical protein
VLFSSDFPHEGPVHGHAIFELKLGSLSIGSCSESMLLDGWIIFELTNGKALEVAGSFVLRGLQAIRYVPVHDRYFGLSRDIVLRVESLDHFSGVSRDSVL